MNLVGKIFVVVILVMSIVFMALSMAVYTVQKNWREVVLRQKEEPGKDLGLKYQVEKLKIENEDLKSQKEKAEKSFTDEKAVLVQANTKLQTKLDIETKDRMSLESGQAAMKKEVSDDVAAMSSTQKNSTDFRAERDTLRKELLEAQQDRDAHFKKVVDLTDQLNQAVDEKELLRRRTDDLAKDVAKANDALLWYKINKDSDYQNANPPKGVKGTVTEVLGHGLIEIDLGSDQGIRVGHRLEVYRTIGGQPTYVGPVEVVKTDPSNSACKIDPKSQNTNVMVNDSVATKID